MIALPPALAGQIGSSGFKVAMFFLALIVAAIVWASVSRVDMIVTAQGKLITTRPNLFLISRY